MTVGVLSPPPTTVHCTVQSYEVYKSHVLTWSVDGTEIISMGIFDKLTIGGIKICLMKITLQCEHVKLVIIDKYVAPSIFN